MGRLIAVEGLDGAGKRTIVSALTEELSARGLTARTLAFPRYGRSLTADLAAEALRGEHGGLSESVRAMALLFALDRAGAVDELHAALAAVDVVLLDRYVASNAAYGAARMQQPGNGEFATWIGGLEFDRLGLPVPDLQVLLAVPTDVAAERARRRGEMDSTRALDAYERDADLQRRTAAAYRTMAEIDWRGPWSVLDGSRSGDREITELSDRITELCMIGHTGARK
ncbi:MAG: dTMP kinase [Mycobacteriaceae bacterium]|nr:dTMP kinase [Mycobacteriaceae bacterium]